MGRALSSNPQRIAALRAWLRRLLACRRGISAIEFGMVLPVIVVIILGTYDVANLVQTTAKLNDALHAGGQYAVSFPGDTTGMQTVIQDALPTGWADVTIAAPVMNCACAAGGGGEAAASCDATPICPLGETTERYITLSATQPYSALLLYSLIPSISASYVARVQ
jgi:Flp pilus assembly protein TadG